LEAPIFPRLALLLALVCVACDGILGIGSTTSTLALPVPGNNRFSQNSMDDPNGLAGLRVTLTGAVERTYDAEDFPVEPFFVPEEGRVFVAVVLVGPDTPGPIATGRMDWELEPNRLWDLRLDRAPWPLLSSYPVPPGETADPCRMGCRGYWRFEIEPSARNYEEEALWLVLWGVEPCPEGAIC